MPSSQAEVLLVGGYQGSALSSVTLAGQDRVTSYTELHIEEGESPLYIAIAIFEDVVVRVTGAQERIERLAMISPDHAGIIGLEPARVTFSPRAYCKWRYVSDPENSQAVQIRERLENSLQRKVELTVGSDRLGKVIVPSGRLEVGKGALPTEPHPL